MTLPEAQWSKDNPGVPPRISLIDKVRKGIAKAVAKDKDEREKSHKVK